MTIVFIVIFFFSLGCAHAWAPAMYIFGDSLADVGNNNHINTSLRCNFPHNGIDYYGGVPTGRCSNGKNSADLLAEKLGLPSPPPYLAKISDSIKVEAYLQGISFASGGAGILSTTSQNISISFDEQIDEYAEVFVSLVEHLGFAKGNEHISKSIFTFMIGSNDVFRLDESGSTTKPTSFLPLLDSMLSTLPGQLERLYNLGARKFLYIGLGPLGCCPHYRVQSKTDDCDVEVNQFVTQLNDGTVGILQHLASELSDLNYAFFDSYNAMLQFIQNPLTYGFIEIKAACCGLGKLNTEASCQPYSLYCFNRTNHLFWDAYHPTQYAATLVTNLAIDGSLPYVFPINGRQLNAL